MANSALKGPIRTKEPSRACRQAGDVLEVMRPTIAGGIRGPVAVAVAALFQGVDVVLIADSSRELVPAMAVLTAAVQEEHRRSLCPLHAPVEIVELEPADADVPVLP
jgi:hypothetical protein